jgi:hydrogenase-4 component F
MSDELLLTLITLDLFLPLGIVAIGILGKILTPLLWDRYPRALDRLTWLVSATCLVLAVILSLFPPEQQILKTTLVPLVGQVGLLIDALSVYFILLVNLVAFAASCNIVSTPPDPQRPFFFNLLLNLFHFTMLLVPIVDNLVALWIAIEATTLVSTLLVSWRRDFGAWDAAWKYLIVTSTGIIFALLGIMFLANAAKGLIPAIVGDPNQVMNWTFLHANVEQLAPDFVKLSFLFIIVGYGTKAGLAPMHTWLPDGHGEAPAPISALLSGVLLKSALYAILRFATLTNASLGSSTFTSGVLLGAGLISLVAATPFILNERSRFKRILAYHSLEHMGIITFGIGIGGEIALFGALLHALNHAVTKSLMFLAFGNIMRRYQERLHVTQDRITGVFQRMPLTGGILALGGLALVGTPPFNIFLSEFIILWGALGRLRQPPVNGLPSWAIGGAVALFLVSTTLIFYGLVRHLARLVLHGEPQPAPVEANRPAQQSNQAETKRLPETVGEVVPLLVLLLLALVSGITIWAPLARLVELSVRRLLLF